MTILMILILALLIFVVSFGAGFIIDMFMKRRWAGFIGYVVLLLYILYRTHFAIGILNWGLLLVSLVGIVFAGQGFQALRKQGYRMFQPGRE